MFRRYTPAQIQFISKNIHGRSYAQMTRLFNRRYGLSVTDGQMKSLLKNHKLRNGFGHGNPTIPRSSKYTPVQIQFLKRNVRGRSFFELAEMFNGHFGLSLPLKTIIAACKNRGLANGRDTRFYPGQVSHNKGKKGACPAGSEKGWFKPGNKPWDYMPVGSERVISGYAYKKVSDIKQSIWKNWAPKHRLIWEKKHGKIPKGCVVIFADGNRSNFSLKNLLLVSRSELGVMCRNGLISANGDLTRAGKIIADIKLLTAKRKQKNGKNKARRIAK